MPRLHYSRNGIVRAVEMSRCTVTAFVEGLIDRMFFGALVASNVAAAGKVVEIRLAHELHPSLGNGKTALLALHTMLKQHSRLLFSLGSGPKAVLIFLDIGDAGFTLEHAPGFAAFHGEQHHLPAHGEILHLAVDLGLERV